MITRPMLSSGVIYPHPLSESAEVLSRQSLGQGVRDFELERHLLVRENALLVLLVQESHLERVVLAPLGLFAPMG